VEQSRDVPHDLLMSLREEMAGTRATVSHLVADVADLKQDVCRLDDRIFQLLLVQLATFVTTLASLATALVSAITA
jgi:hypothetical protein